MYVTYRNIMMLCVCNAHVYIGRFLKGSRRERERDGDPGEISAKIEPLVLQRVQHGDASHKHFVGLAETITTQINAQHSLYLRRFEGLVLCLLLCFLSETILHGGLNLAPWPRLLQSMSPYLVLKVGWQ